MPRIELTDKLVRSLGSGLWWDTHERAPEGFLLQVSAAGGRAYRLNYRRKSDGRERRMTIGSIAEYPQVKLARERAAELRREIRDGRDPIGEHEARRAAPTVAELVERYLTEGMTSLRPSTRREYRGLIDNHILPRFGEKKVADVKREDAATLHRELTAEINGSTGEQKKRRANAAKTMLSILLGKAVEWGWREDNPARTVKAHAEHGRERPLELYEIERLFDELDRRREQWPDACDAIKLAVLTGCRRSELLFATWKQFDLTAKVWVKPSTMTKQKRQHRLVLSDAVVELLRRRVAERDGRIISLRRGLYVFFRGENRKTPSNQLETQWRAIRGAAGLEGVRFHDLRHSHASVLASQGVPLNVIGRMLGHQRITTTQRYSHLFEQPLREAAEVVARIVSGKPLK